MGGRTEEDGIFPLDTIIPGQIEAVLSEMVLRERKYGIIQKLQSSSKKLQKKQDIEITEGAENIRLINIWVVCSIIMRQN